MDHADHLNLIRKGVPNQGGVWAEFGSGKGAFTLALAELIGLNGVIFSVDKDRRVLKEQERAIKKNDLWDKNPECITYPQITQSPSSYLLWMAC